MRHQGTPRSESIFISHHHPCPETSSSAASKWKDPAPSPRRLVGYSRGPPSHTPIGHSFHVHTKSTKTTFEQGTDTAPLREQRPRRITCVVCTVAVLHSSTPSPCFSRSILPNQPPLRRTPWSPLLSVGQEYNTWKGALAPACHSAPRVRP
jgi:hypothetical protein